MRETPATLLVVSHDRRLLEKTCDRLWVVDEGRVAPFEGGYRAWRAAAGEGWRIGEAYAVEEARFHGRPGRAGGAASRAHGRSTTTAVEAPAPGPPPAAPPARAAARRPKLSKDAYRRQKVLIDDDLTRLGLRKSHLELALLDPAIAANFVELRRVTSELADVDQALGAAEEAWLLLEERAP
jgi:energy-coupling factor transporter ATP-binding protein EcfA2